MMTQNNMPIWPGWETVRLIGRGSFGAVYEIERDVLGETEKAALKVITIPENSSDIEAMRDEGYDDESITGSFKEQLKSTVSEYALMRKLNGYTNVVNCDDVRYVQHEDGFGWDIFIKMELLTPMKKALDRTVTDEQAARVGEDICRALILCRKFNIIHRDIKPDNIFAAETGDYKLGDFGIAKMIEKTSGGTKIGTYDYMAPEVYRGLPYGSSADIYSLGMVLYWMLNERRTAFLPLPPVVPSLTEKETARIKRLNGEPLPAPAHGSEELKRIILKACAFDPNDRYQSAEEMLHDLEEIGSSGIGTVQDPRKNGNNLPVWPGWKTAEKIGQGSFSAFYEIERDVPGGKEKAALKVIHVPHDYRNIDELRKEGVNEEGIAATLNEQLKEIQDEYALMRKLSGSANVVNWDDVRYERHSDNIGWDVLIKKELLTALLKYLSREQHTDEDLAVRLGKDMCRALAECARHKIIHRDIKPQNIYVAPNGAFKLGNFGVACIKEQTSTATERVGTTAYMAPEEYNNLPYNRTADIYSLGLVLYWLLNERRVPFAKDNTMSQREEALRRRMRGEALPAPVHGSEELKRIILKACAFDPKNRYQTAEEMLRDLEAIGREPRPTPPHTPTQKSIEVGDIITFGHYKQDNNKSNGPEPIEWQVLAKDDSRALVISKYVLDCQPFNALYEDTTWAVCTLRKWLNETFLNTAFTEEERSKIPVVIVSAGKDRKYIIPGKDTQDRIFLLSSKEAVAYFTSVEGLKCQATTYSKAEGTWTDDNGYCQWWLRSPGARSHLANHVCHDGLIDLGGSFVGNSIGVRPALWIDLES